MSCRDTFQVAQSGGIKGKARGGCKDGVLEAESLGVEQPPRPNTVQSRAIQGVNETLDSSSGPLVFSELDIQF